MNLNPKVVYEGFILRKLALLENELNLGVKLSLFDKSLIASMLVGQTKEYCLEAMTEIIKDSTTTLKYNSVEKRKKRTEANKIIRKKFVKKKTRGNEKCQKKTWKKRELV